MPALTPNLSFPIPVGTDAPDVVGDMTRLANALDTYLANLVTKAVGELFHFYDTGLGLPAGALLCDGSTFSAASYPKLNTHLGGTQLPDLRGRVLLGASSAFPLLSQGGFTDAVLIDHNHNGAPHTHGMTHNHAATGSFSGSVGATDINHRHRYDHGHPQALSNGAGNHGHGTTGAPGVAIWDGQGNLGLYNNAQYGKGMNILNPAYTTSVGDHQHYVDTPSTGAIWSDWMWEGNPHGHTVSGSVGVSVSNYTGSTAAANFSAGTGQAANASGAVVTSAAGRNMPPYRAVSILIQAR